MTNTIQIYELCVKDIGGLYFIPPDLVYFDNHFICQPELKKWRAPPVQVKRSQKKPSDFISWMLRAPVVRERIRWLLEDAFAGCVEFLPFYTLRSGETLFVMNVLNLDQEKAIFKKDPYSLVYVRNEFGKLAISHSFTGIALADPQADNTALIMRGKDVNVFPGLS